MKAPVALFVYARPDLTRLTVEALQKNTGASESKLYIYSDGPKNPAAEERVRKVREYIRTIDGFADVIITEREKNLGLAKNIISGVTEVVNRHGRIIVLEDDMITSPVFLEFMNRGLDLYENEEKVASIHGYIYPIDGLPDVFFMKGADCWGWATWKRAWDIFEPDGRKLLAEVRRRNAQKDIDFNHSYGYIRMLKDQIAGRNDSWAVRWHISAYLQGMYTLYPGKTYVQNIGFGKDATHCNADGAGFQSGLHQELRIRKIPVTEDPENRKKFEEYFRASKVSLLQKILGRIKRYV